MPKRPRSHQLEDESWKIFGSVIPNNWVLRKTHPDYGIDGEIEIFDKSDNSTGFIFFFQLKGTDENDLKKALVFRFPIETIKYYSSLQLPVLLVRYYSCSSSLYYRWSYGIDLYYSREASKSINVYFSEDFLWTKDTPTILEKNVNAFRKVKDSTLPLPIEFRFDFSEKELFSTPIGMLESSIRDISSTVSDIISLSSGPFDSSIPRIKITKNIILVDIFGITTFNLHLKGYPKEKILTHLPHDVLIGIAFVLHKLGHHSIAADIAEKHILSSNILSNYNLILEIINCFILSRRIDISLKLSEQILDTEDDKDLYKIFAIPAYAGSQMSKQESLSFKRLLLKAIEKAKKNKYSKEVAICYYNLGNHLRGIGGWKNFKESLYHYRMAVKYEPNYKNREYFWREVAGVLFLLERYRYAERAYNRAIKLGSATNCLALHADALMFAGKYKEAYEVFKEYEKLVDKPNDEWILKRWILHKILKEIELDTQIRYRKKALNCADMHGLSKEESIISLHQALSYDVLCGLAWFNLGVCQSSNNDYCKALVSFLIAGLVQPKDIESWSNVIICSFNCIKHRILLPYVLRVAYHINGESILREFSKSIEKQQWKGEVQSLKTDIINFISEYIHSIEKKDKCMPILRFIKPDGTYEVIDPNNQLSLQDKND